MVLKKKEVKVEALILDSGQLENLGALKGDPLAEQIAEFLQECAKLTDGVQQIQLIKKVGSLLEQLSEDEAESPLMNACLETLACVFFSLHSRNPLKRALASALSTVPGCLQNQSVRCLSQRLSQSLTTCSSTHYAHLTDTITACLDGFHLGESCIHSLLTEVLQFLQKALSEYQQQNSRLVGTPVAQAQLMQACLATVKASMLVVQRSQKQITAVLQAAPDSPLMDTLCDLLRCYTSILTEGDFVQTVQSTAGMAVVLLTRSMTGPSDCVASVVASLLLGSEERVGSAPQWLLESCGELYHCVRPTSVTLFLCHGALAMLSWRGKAAGSGEERLLLLIPKALLSLDSSVRESSTAISVARVLTLWSCAALEVLQGEHCSASLRHSLTGGTELVGRLLEHIYAHWEHPLDGVRHQTKALFKNVLKLHQIATRIPDPLADPFITSLTHSLLGLEWHSKGKYGSLSCLVDYLGAESLLALDPQLPAQLLSLMGDQSLAPYASSLLETLFVNHKAQLASCHERGDSWMEMWHQTWVTPLLAALCEGQLDQTTYILDYCLPKILRCSPGSVEHMVRALQSSQHSPAGNNTGSPDCRGALGALVTCLRAARAQGVVSSSQEGLWGGLVPLKLLSQALVHKHDQVRLDALGLICESHRSTENLSPEEMDLIRFFLPSSLNSQSPGVRQQTLSLLKKLLCRMRDSAQLLQRRLEQDRPEEQGQEHGNRTTLQTYEEFLHWLCEALFQALFPGASFPTCFTALHLLGLIADLFSFSTADSGPCLFSLGQMVTPSQAQAVLYCLASSFLEVKQLAFQLLRRLPPPALGLQEPGRLSSLLRVALDLSTSTKPFDSVTASHLLNLLVYEEGLVEALSHRAQEQCISFQPPTPGESPASKAFKLERNTLAVVLFLLACLKAEVAQAETSLLQAAASYPLYGRAHCITVALQQLDSQSLLLVAEWRPVVAELIEMSYRMSDVVSPVVQSSSPEGLIPMDTDSESSACLQQILQEIQPRDTNDFFTSPRQLGNSEPEQGGGSLEQAHAAGATGGGEEQYRVTAQMVLVCCWRTMKEVSMLLGMLCQNLPLQTEAPPREGLITEQQVEGVGRYFRQQLLQSRHRGAFELAYVGFVKLTDMLARSPGRALQQLPGRWLSEVLEEVRSSGPTSKLCATRRSAGIPFYIQALLSSEPKSSSCSLLRMTMKELTALALSMQDNPTDGSSVPQVHSLNILRALFRDTRLSENIVPYVAEGVQAAILGFTSPVWAVRNSSTLLFSTLITRIFGVKKGKDENSRKNRMTGREFFTRFPALYPFLLRQLEAVASTVDSDSGVLKLHPNLFLLLLLLGKLYPSPMDGFSSPLGLAPFVPFIVRCGRSPVYRSREMAARALVPFVLVTQVPSMIQTLLQDLPECPRSATRQNHIHGTLLQVLHLLRSYQEDRHRPHSLRLPQTHDIIAAVRARLWLARRQNPCVVTRAAFLDVLACLCGPEWGPVDDEELTGLREATLVIVSDSELFDPDSFSTAVAGGTQYLLSLARIAVCASLENPVLWGAEFQGPQLLAQLLQCQVYEVRLLALEAILQQLERGPSDRHPAPCPLSTVTTILTNLAMQETHPQCMGKVLRALSLRSVASILPWQKGSEMLGEEELLHWALTVCQESTHRVENHCAALTLVSNFVVHFVEKSSQGLSKSMQLEMRTWVALVSQCCGDERPGEVKLTAAEVLVNATPCLLASAVLPLGLSDTVCLWKSLFTLLQDEDQDVRDRAADFTGNVPPQLLTDQHTGFAPSALCPALALDLGLGLLCQLFQMWKEAPAGVLILAEWLLGEGDPEREAEDGRVLDEDEFLFEKGEGNLWAERLLWVRLLDKHLSGLVSVPGTLSGIQEELVQLFGLARNLAQTSDCLLQALPPEPQFSSSADFTRLTIQRERTARALETLKATRPATLS
ncbi:thyroid adenoma-associated protein isoform X1 [Lepisosteus oculatus]|uniref:thyroid adenoma-associated protein isoform X1 n=1 Tax=Lepisosteus oculatus TaxID=7918 RepID=UPI0035F505EC